MEILFSIVNVIMWNRSSRPGQPWSSIFQYLSHFHANNLFLSASYLFKRFFNHSSLSFSYQYTVRNIGSDRNQYWCQSTCQNTNRWAGSNMNQNFWTSDWFRKFCTKVPKYEPLGWFIDIWTKNGAAVPEPLHGSTFREPRSGSYIIYTTSGS